MIFLGVWGGCFSRVYDDAMPCRRRGRGRGDARDERGDPIEQPTSFSIPYSTVGIGGFRICGEGPIGKREPIGFQRGGGGDCRNKNRSGIIQAVEIQHLCAALRSLMGVRLWGALFMPAKLGRGGRGERCRAVRQGATPCAGVLRNEVQGG